MNSVDWLREPDRLAEPVGYDHKNLLREVDLSPDGHAKVIAKALAMDEHGRPFSGLQVFGVGEKLYFLDGWKVFILEGW